MDVCYVTINGLCESSHSSLISAMMRVKELKNNPYNKYLKYRDIGIEL